MVNNKIVNLKNPPIIEAIIGVGVKDCFKDEGSILKLYENTNINSFKIPVLNAQQFVILPKINLDKNFLISEFVSAYRVYVNKDVYANIQVVIKPIETELSILFDIDVHYNISNMKRSFNDIKCKLNDLKSIKNDIFFRNFSDAEELFK